MPICLPSLTRSLVHAMGAWQSYSFSHLQGSYVLYFCPPFNFHLFAAYSQCLNPILTHQLKFHTVSDKKCGDQEICCFPPVAHFVFYHFVKVKYKMMFYYCLDENTGLHINTHIFKTVVSWSPCRSRATPLKKSCKRPCLLEHSFSSNFAAGTGDPLEDAFLLCCSAEKCPVLLLLFTRHVISSHRQHTALQRKARTGRPGSPLWR